MQGQIRSPVPLPTNRESRRPSANGFCRQRSPSPVRRPGPLAPTHAFFSHGLGVLRKFGKIIDQRRDLCIAYGGQLRQILRPQCALEDSSSNAEMLADSVASMYERKRHLLFLGRFQG